MKKAISILISLVMMIGIVLPRTVHAQAQPNISLEKAIEIAKEAFNLNTQGYDVSFSYREGQNGKSYHEINWHRDKSPYANINVTVDAQNGDITSMYRYEENQRTQSKIPKYTKDQALAAANQLAEKLQPVNFKNMKLETEVLNTSNRYYYNSETYTFNYVRQLNGYKFPENAIRIEIDKNTLVARSYSYSWNDGPFPEPSKAMSIDDVKKIFKEKLGIELSYRLIYDSETKENKPILVYSLKKGNYPIDAITGEILNSSQIVYDKEMYSKNEAGAGIRQSLTPEELKSIEDSKKFITKEAAMAVLEKYVSEAKDAKFEAANLYTFDNGKNASWSLSWNSVDKNNETEIRINAEVNAITSELRSFYLYGKKLEPDNKTEPIYTEAQAKEIAEKFLKNIQPEKFALCQYNEPENMIQTTEKPDNYFFNYFARINGAVCSFDAFNVSVSSYTGKVQSFSMYWQDINLPSTEGAMSLDDAYTKLFSNVNYEMKYMNKYSYNRGTESSPEVKLAYILDNYSGMLDARTGDVLDYSGKPVKEIKEVSFTDIKGTPSQNDIQLLMEMGVIDDSSDKFNPNNDILQKDFIKYIVRSMNPYSYSYFAEDSKDEYEKYYTQAIQSKIISEKEKNPEAKVTRQQAAKMLVRAIGAGFIADHGDLFAVSFKDAGSIAVSNRGYAVIAARFNLIITDKGYFYPSKTIKRGEAATMIVNSMKADINLAE